MSVRPTAVSKAETNASRVSDVVTTLLQASIDGIRDKVLIIQRSERV